MASQTTCDACGKVIVGSSISVRWERSEGGPFNDHKKRGEYLTACNSSCEGVLFLRAVVQAGIEPVKAEAERARRERETGYVVVVEALNAQIAAKAKRRGGDKL